MIVDLKKLKFDIDLSKANFQIDALQEELLRFYLRADRKFRKAFNQNYTPHFIQYLKDKSRLKEPIHISIIGATRSGKSSIGITIAIIHSALNGRDFDIEYICGNSYEFLEKLKTMPQEELLNSIFLIDEEKKLVMGYGSTARKLKLTDVQNIIAINNISTISITPDKWANEQADYGLRTFGRCFGTKLVRTMLYNLKGGKGQSETPMGNIYFPSYLKEGFLPKDYTDELEREYLRKKNEWVLAEQRGEGDVLMELKRDMAQNFTNDEQYLSLKKKQEKLTYITMKLGSEWTIGECNSIYALTELIKKGIDLNTTSE